METEVIAERLDNLQAARAAVAGYTYSPQFPVTVGAFERAFGSSSDGFDGSEAPVVPFTNLPGGIRKGGWASLTALPQPDHNAVASRQNAPCLHLFEGWSD